jgi:hypothetical protein
VLRFDSGGLGGVQPAKWYFIINRYSVNIAIFLVVKLSAILAG